MMILKPLAEPRPDTGGGVKIDVIASGISWASRVRTRAVMASADSDGSRRWPKSSNEIKNWPKLEPLALSVNDWPAMPVVWAMPLSGRTSSLIRSTTCCVRSSEAASGSCTAM